MRKNEKGMTLVMLVITIVILLILAGVAITLTISNGGLVDKIQKSVVVYNSSAVNETKVLNESENMIESIIVELD